MEFEPLTHPVLCYGCSLLIGLVVLMSKAHAAKIRSVDLMTERKLCCCHGIVKWKLPQWLNICYLNWNLLVDWKKWRLAPSGRSLRSSPAWQSKLPALGGRAVFIVLPWSYQLAEPLWTDPSIKSGISVSDLISTLKKRKAQVGNKSPDLPPNPRSEEKIIITTTKRREI